MLRASSAHTGDELDLKTVTGETAGDGGIAHGALLTAFAEAAIGDDDQILADLRTRIRQQIGDDALVDSAAVAGLFNAIDRVADSTGIPLEDAKAEDTVDLRQDLGIDRFHSVQQR